MPSRRNHRAVGVAASVLAGFAVLALALSSGAEHAQTDDVRAVSVEQRSSYAARMNQVLLQRPVTQMLNETEADAQASAGEGGNSTDAKDSGAGKLEFDWEKIRFPTTVSDLFRRKDTFSS